METINERSWELFDDEREKLNRLVLDAVRQKKPINSDKILKQDAAVHSAYIEFRKTSNEYA